MNKIYWIAYFISLLIREKYKIIKESDFGNLKQNNIMTQLLIMQFDIII